MTPRDVSKEQYKALTKEQRDFIKSKSTEVIHNIDQDKLNIYWKEIDRLNAIDEKLWCGDTAYLYVLSLDDPDLVETTFNKEERTMVRKLTDYGMFVMEEVKDYIIYDFQPSTDDKWEITEAYKNYEKYGTKTPADELLADEGFYFERVSEYCGEQYFVYAAKDSWDTLYETITFYAVSGEVVYEDCEHSFCTMTDGLIKAINAKRKELGFEEE